MSSRDEFRLGTFRRDNNTCVVPGCGKPAIDAHHIMERALWLADDLFPEGYHPHNGASVCELHHRACEANAIPPAALRRWLNVPTILPQQLDPNKIWNKWGEEIKPSLRVQAKYPSTPYLPISETQDGNSGVIDPELLLNKPLAFTIKMDGSNVMLTREVVTARNGTAAYHASFDLLKAQHAGFKDRIPEGCQLFGEWLFARHSIHYRTAIAIYSYLQIFAIYEQKTQLFLPWKEVLAFCEEAGFKTVPVLRIETFDKQWKLLDAAHKVAREVIAQGHEGIVLKSCWPYHYAQHEENIAKIVRANHVQTDVHWQKQKIVKNELC